jgi:hypothetical protein
MISPDLHFRDVLAFMCSNVFNFDFEIVLLKCTDCPTERALLTRPIPVSMFDEDGTMRKSCKSDLVKQFENEVSPVLSLPDFDPSLTTYIRDSMALVQCMDAKKHRTFAFSRLDGVVFVKPVTYISYCMCFCKA